MRPAMARLGTGSAALDQIVGGGLPVGSVTILAGEPGAGKTVLALQALFRLARDGGKGIYFTTLSEPAMKLVRFMQGFAFFDERLIADRVLFADLGTTLRADGPAAALERMVARIEEEEPALVVVDSFKAIQDLIGDPVEARGVAYDLAVALSAWGATTLLLGEYGADEIAARPEFAIADGIVRLLNERQELTSSRELEVLKLRGTGFVGGRHFFEIGDGGLAVYPRVRAPEQIVEGWSSAHRLPTGVPGLDGLLGGGLPTGSATLVEGATGAGKTLLALHFLTTGAATGEPGVLFTFEETPDQLRGIAANFGLDLARLEAADRLRIVYTSPVELSTDRFLDRARQQIAALGARRVVLDSLTSLSVGVPSERRFRELVYATAKHVRATGATLLMTMEVPTLLGSTQLTGYGVLSSADNLLLLRYVEIDGRLVRALTVLKERGVGHDAGLHRATVDGAGLRIGPPFDDLRGVLTGVPERTRPVAE